MTITVFGLSITLLVHFKKKTKRGPWMAPNGAKIGNTGYTLVLCDPDGCVIPNQRDLTITAPLNGPVTATCEFNISGLIDGEPKEWEDRAAYYKRMIIQGLNN